MILFRLIYILWILVFYRIHPAFSKSNKYPRRLSKALVKLGPIFIKLGQALSVRHDIVGAEIAHCLRFLQDRLPGFSSDVVARIIEDEFKKPINEIFSEFDLNPIAAASVAQVHKAITIEGQVVAVKILRPNIHQYFARDIKLFYFLARILNKFFSKCSRLKLEQVIYEFEQGVKFELDLRFEAASSSLIKENCTNDDSIYIPRVFWQLTTNNIMTSQWVDAISIYDIASLKERNFDLVNIAKNIAINFFNQAYRDGFFHADLHPGNIMIDYSGRIVLIDFGIMGRLNKQDKLHVIRIVKGFLTKKYQDVAQAHFDAGYVPSDQSIEQFALACRSIGEPICGLPVRQISVAKLVGQLFEISEYFNMQTQPQLLLLQKTMMLIEGICMELDPEINMWELALPWFEDWSKENLSMKSYIKDVITLIISKIESLKAI